LPRVVTFGTAPRRLLCRCRTHPQVPADGILLRSHNLKANESELTGESDDIAKDTTSAPVLISGSQIAGGTGDYVVTGVGLNSLQGAIMRDVSVEGDETPLQAKLDALATRIGYVGTACALGTFVALMIIKGTGSQPDSSWASWSVQSFIYAITIVVVAIPEGLPLAVTISLAYSTRKMLADQNLIRHLDACETMGGATVRRGKAESREGGMGGGGSNSATAAVTCWRHSPPRSVCLPGYHSVTVAGHLLRQDRHSDDEQDDRRARLAGRTHGGVPTQPADSGRRGRRGGRRRGRRGTQWW
jgi:hypothetical protein